MALYEETKNLQKERDAKFSTLSTTPQKTFLDALSEKADVFTGFTYDPTNTLDTEVSAISEQPDSFKRRLGSFYDPTLNNENFLAEQQSGLQRLGYMIPRISTKALSEVAQLPGYLGGAVAWGIHGFEKNDIDLLVDNFWQKAIQGVEEDVKDRLPVYVSDALKSGSLMKNIFSTSFWANEGADGVGFLLGFLTPGLALRGLGFGAKTAKLLKPGTSFIRGLKAGAAPEEIASALSGTKFAANIDDISSTLINTLFESAAEGGQSYNTVLEKTGDKNKAAEAAVDVLTKNFGILSISNYIDQKWLFGKANLISDYSAKKVAEGVSKSMFKRVLAPSGELLDNVAQRTAWGNIGNVGKTIGSGFLKEGFWEEGMQFAASKRVEQGEPNDQGFLEELLDIGKTYVDSLGDTDMQKSIFLGGVLGSGMSTVSTIKGMRQEDKVLTSFHQLVRDNFIDRYRNISDLAQTEVDADGNTVPKFKEDGTYEIDVPKAQEQLSKYIVKYIQGKQLIELAKAGNTEAFEKIKNERDLNYFFPFLQVEGGLEAAMNHIDALAETDVASMQKEGVPIDLEETKKELKDKVIKYQNIYNRIQDTHDLNMNVKYSESDKAIFKEFSDLIKSDKMGAEATIQYSADRVNKIKNDLSNFKASNTTSTPIISEETKYNTKLVEDLKQSLKDQKSNLTPTDISNVENMIKNIEGHVSVIEFAKNKLSDLYTKKYLQTEFNSYKESKQAKTDSSISNATTEENKKIVVDKKAKIEQNRLDSLHEITEEDLKNGIDIGLSVDEKGVWTGQHYNSDDVWTEDFTGTKEEVIKKLNDKYDEELRSLIPVVPQDKSLPVIPEDRFSNIKEVHKTLNDYEKDYKHPFSITAGIDNWLMSTGDQRDAVNNDNIARWYIFTNNYAYQTDKTGRHKHTLRSYTYDQIGQLDKNDPIRQNVTFFVGTENGKSVFRTYDQITDPSLVKDEIKIVVFTRDGKVLRVSKLGEIDTEDKSQLVYNTLPLPSSLSAKGFERFSTKAEKVIYYRNNKINTKPTPEQEKNAEKYVQSKIKESLEQYKTFREELKLNPSYFDISRINPGIKLTKDAKDTEVLEATGLKSAKSLYKRIEAISKKEGESDKVERNISGAVHGLVNGFWYIKMNNRYELIKPKTLNDTGSVEDIIKLIQQYSKDTFNQNDLGKFLSTILYTGVNDSTGKISPYRLQFDYQNKSLIFGEKSISIQDIVDGNNLEDLRTFLGTKYWNFDKNYLDSPEFIEYFIDKAGEIKTRLWELNDGGYKGFLFSPIEGNKTKGTLYIKPKQEGLKAATDPQYLNQSISMVRLGNDLKKIPSQNTQSTWTKTPDTLGESLDQPFIPMGQKPVATQNPMATLGEPLSQPFVPMGSKLAEPIQTGQKQEVKKEVTLATPFRVVRPAEPNGLGDQTPIQKEDNKKATPIKNIEKTLFEKIVKIIGNPPNLSDWFGDTENDKKHQKEFDHIINLLKQNNIFSSQVVASFEIIPILNGTANAIRITEEDDSTMDIMDGGARDTSSSWKKAEKLLNNDPQFKKYQEKSNIHLNDVLLPYIRSQIFEIESNPFQSYFINNNKFNTVKQNFGEEIPFVDIPKTKQLTSDEYWNSLTKDKQDKYLKQANNDLDIAKQKAHFTHLLTLEDNDDLNREATAFDNYQLENLNQTKAWLKAKFPNIPVEVVDGLIDGKSWGKLTKSARILLSSIAAEGTGYHEGFHTFSQLVLADQSRKELYDEVRKRLPGQTALVNGEPETIPSSTLTDKECEEILAEEFRMFMMSPAGYSFSKYEKVKKNFFQKLFDLILNFFGIENKTAKDFQIEMVFDILKNGQFDVVSKELPNDFDRKVDRNRIENLTDKETLLFTRDLNFTFFKILFDQRANYTDSALFGSDTTFTEIYGAMSSYYEDMAENKKGFYKKISDNFDELVKEHTRFLKQYKINVTRLINEGKDEKDDDDKESNTDYSYQDSLNINLADLIDNQVRFLIAGLPSITRDQDILSNLTKYKTRSTVRFNRIINILNDNLTNLGTDFNEYVDKIKELSNHYPELTELLNRLQVGKQEISSPIMLLRNQFVRSFAHNKNIPLLTNYQLDGSKNTFNAATQETQRLIRNTWLNQARSVVDYAKSYIIRTKDSRGVFVLDLPKLQNSIKLANALKDKSREQLNEYLTILKGLGITITYDFNNIYNYDLIKGYVNRLSQEITSKKEILLSDLFNPDVIKNQKETKALIEYAQSFLINDTDLSFYNQDGNKEYSINLNSHTTDTINLLNKITYDIETGKITFPEGMEHLKGWNGKTGNLFNRFSVWGEHLTNNGKLKVVDLKGLVDQFNSKNSSEISKAAFGDYKSITFNALLNGISIHLRSADRKRELGFMMTDEDGNQIKHNTNITQDNFKQKMYGYLKDELATSFALIVDPTNWGGNLTHYSKNAKQLRTFNFLYDSELNKESTTTISTIENYANNYAFDSTKDTISQVDEMVKEFVSTNLDYIDKSFDRYINKMNQLTEDSLKEDSVIVENYTSKGESRGIYIPGLDTEVLEKFNIVPMLNVGIITRKDLNKLILFANYTQFIGSQEQLKFIMGDMAMWLDTTDFHKRVNGTTSPKNKLSDSEDLRQQMNTLYPRVDSKERTSDIDIVVVNDIISSNIELAKKFVGYNKIKGTDAESWATLDEYRDIMIRHGNWFPAQEKTYQFEMQKFMLRLLEMKKNKVKLPFLNKVNKGMFTDPDGIFYKHTNGKLPKDPMYNGKVILEKECGVLSIQKPQGFGHIVDINGLYAPQFFKTSTAPIFPSSISDTNPILPDLLSMMDKAQGILTFNSAMKGEVIGSQKLTLPKEGYISQKLSYNDFGLQLDISDEEKDEVTVSTQRTRLEFLDVFDNGKLAKNKNLAVLRDEYVKVTNEIIEAERNELINKLGLKWNSGSQSYELVEGEESKDKFKKKLIQAFDFALMPYNIIDGLNLALDSSEKVFDVTVSKFKIEEILTAMVRRDVISRKTKGDMLVQESSFLYDPTLKFYRLEGGKVLPMEIMISLPKELLQFTEDFGGLDKLNTAIEQHDVKLLGEEFFKMLDIPMNRIPGQSLSSLDIGHVKKFLPHYHGVKVVLPAEITVKAGSDFDVDKMTSYFNYIEVVDGQVRYFTNPDRLEGKKNRLNEIAREALLDPERFDELIEPLTANTIRGLIVSAQAKIMKSPIETETFNTSPNQQNKWENVPTWWYNMQKGHEFFRGKMGTAMAAVHNAANSLGQVHPIRVKAFVPLFFKDQIYTKQSTDTLGNPITIIDQDQFYNTGFIYDANDHKVSRNFAEFLTSFVDVVKDPFIFDLTDNFTFNTLAFLNRYGKTSGVGLESIISFMTQDSIKGYLKVRRRNTPKFLQINQYHNNLRPNFKLRLSFEEQYEETVRILKEGLNGTDTNIPLKYSDTIASSLYNLLELDEASPKRLDILNEIRDKVAKYQYKGFSTKTLNSNDIRSNFHDQVQILDNFLMYQILGQNLTQLNLQMRPDARGSLGRHISAVEANQVIPTDNIESKGLFVLEDIGNMLGTEDNKTLITEFYKTQTSMKTMFGWTSLVHKDPVISDFFEKYIYTHFADPGKWKTKKEVDKVITDVESDLLTFIMADSLQAKDYTEQQNIYKYLFTDNNSIPEKLLQLKKSVKGNLAINELEPLIAQRMNKTRTLSETDNITLFNKNIDVHALDVIEGDLYDLGVDTNPENQKFVYELMFHSVFQSGFHNAANSYMSVVPNRLFIDIAEKAVGKFMALSDEAKVKKLDSFYEQLFRNNAYNTKIVPRSPWTIRNGNLKYGFPKVFVDGKIDEKTGKVLKKPYYSKYEYIAFNYNTHDPRSFTKKGLKAPKGVVLYQRVDENTFIPISKLGDGIRFKEFYPMIEAGKLDRSSILKANVYEKLPIDVPYTESTGNNNPITELYGFDDDIDVEENPSAFDSSMIGRNNADAFIPEEQTNSYFKVLKQRSTVQQALGMIERNSPNEAYRTLAKVLRTNIRSESPLIISQQKFETMDNIDMKTGLIKSLGYYYSDTNRTYVYEKLTDKAFEQTLLHEAIHVLAEREYLKSGEFTKKIDRLAEYTKYILANPNASQYAKDILEEYGFTLTEKKNEFLTYALTDSNFQAALAQLPSENPEVTKGILEQHSIFKEFLDTLFDLITKYFNQIFSTSQPGYAEKLKGQISVIHDLIALVQTDLLEKVSNEEEVNETVTNLDKKDINKNELSKEVLKDFDSLYPEYEYLNDIEKEAFTNAVNIGEIQLNCGI